ncbi:MAG: ribose-phosphate pyrophosphokinase [Betaproteobacteria bacterium]|nr:ribose-phosphate pyrophosphokinase [Betaproteobacteria bacterium]MDH3438301.1 ribose-phosphate pyrophosphokinase [Betaproteobacteria bacterium]
MNRAMVLFALKTSRDFGAKVAEQLQQPLGELEEREFEDGEHKARPLISVRGADVFVIHSLYGEPGQSANDKLCRLAFFIGALRDAACASVTAVVPYLCYARKDRKTKSRDPVTTRYVAQMLEAVGADRVVTLDVHNLVAFQNAFRCRTEHLEAAGLFVKHLAPKLDSDPVVVLSPDLGGVKRADYFRERLEKALNRSVDSAFMEKKRSAGVVSGEAFVGDVAGKTVLVVDDMIAGGTTTRRAVEACAARKAKRVLALATHGLFMPGAETLFQQPLLERIIVTDSVPPFRLAPEVIGDRLVVLDTAPLFAEAVSRIHGGGSVVALLES